MTSICLGRTVEQFEELGMEEARCEAEKRNNSKWPAVPAGKKEWTAEMVRAEGGKFIHLTEEQVSKMSSTIEDLDKALDRFSPKVKPS